MRRSIDSAPAYVVDLLHGQAAALDAAAELLEHRADVAIAERGLARRLERLRDLSAAVPPGGYVPDDVAALLACPDAAALRAAAERYRQRALWESGRRAGPVAA